MRPRFVRAGTVLFCVSIAACGAFGADDTNNPVAPAADASNEASPSDATDADACAADNPATSNFTSTTEWIVRGDAIVDAAHQLGQLTPAMSNKLGALWWSQRVHIDDFELSFELRVENGGDSAEGLAFAWAEAKAPPTLGNASVSLGACGLSTAWAVLFSMVPRGSDPQTSPVRVVDTLVCTGSDKQVPAMADGKWHPVLIAVKAGSLDLTIDGALQLSKVLVPGYKTGGVDGYWGFTGATSTKSETHEVRDVKMVLTKEPRCTR